MERGGSVDHASYTARATQTDGMNHYPKHVGDYIKKTVGLSMVEDGAYTRLLDQAYITEAPLPLDRAEVYRMARAMTKPERDAVDRVLAKFFDKGSDGYRQNRVDEELAAIYGRSDSARQSAEKRWSRRNAVADADAMRTHSDGTAKAMLPITQHPLPHRSSTASGAAASPAAPSGRKPNGHDKATRLPADWTLPDDWKEWAVKVHNLDPQKVVRISLVFRDFWHSKAGPGGSKLDWAATWRNWIRRDVGDA